ncbi:hypothetical protein [Lunatibacter salilacus]|uniref:hypothetical protein n=1 Tax=Lunatibacter salilacus TaxID=2483804 RepID=UPI00131B777D|nr:hypothetical protein [Lunatibacter salilacus]
MKKAFYTGTVILLFTAFPAVCQNLREFIASDLTGYWQTDSAAQLGAKTNRLPHTDYPADKAMSDGMDRAIRSREYIFHDNGMFTAQWLLGTKPAAVDGTWGMVSGDTVFIEVDGTKTAYAVNSHRKDGIVLVPLRERRGEVHELYFVKRQE